LFALKINLRRALGTENPYLCPKCNSPDRRVPAETSGAAGKKPANGRQAFGLVEERGMAAILHGDRVKPADHFGHAAWVAG
jgi:hypothetical protein